MNRNSIVQGLVLATKPVGENNRLATVLTPDRGVLTAMVFGGRKGKLRSSVSPYHSGTMWLYIDAVKQSIKVNDFDPVKYRSEIRTNLYKTYAAAFCAEIIIKNHCFASNVITPNHFEDTTELWVLVNAFLDGLHASSENDARTGTLRFIWRYLSHLGIQCDTSMCSYCQNPVSWYSIQEQNFLCNDCSHYEHKNNSSLLFQVSNESIAYLEAIMNLEPKEVRAIKLSQQSIQELHELLFYLIQQATHSKLQTLDAGRGIL